MKNTNFFILNTYIWYSLENFSHMYIYVIQVYVCVNIDAQIYVCLHVYGHTHVGAYVHVWVCIESPRLTLHIFLTYSPWNSLRQGLAIKFRTHELTILPGDSFSAFLILELQGGHHSRVFVQVFSLLSRLLKHGTFPNSTLVVTCHVSLNK